MTNNRLFVFSQITNKQSVRISSCSLHGQSQGQPGLGRQLSSFPCPRWYHFPALPSTKHLTSSSSHLALAIDVREKPVPARDSNDGLATFNVDQAVLYAAVTNSIRQRRLKIAETTLRPRKNTDCQLIAHRGRMKCQLSDVEQPRTTCMVPRTREGTLLLRG